MRLLLAALVGLCLVLVLFLLLWLGLCGPLVLLRVVLRLGVALLGLVATEAAVRVVFRVAVRVGGLHDPVSGAVRVQMGLVGLSSIGDAAVNSRTRLAGSYREAFTIITNEAVIAFLGFSWGAKRVVLLPGRLFITGIGKWELLPGGGRTTAMHGGSCLTHCRERVVGVRLWSSLHAWSIGVIDLSLGHETTQDGIWVISWRRSWGARLTVHGVGVIYSVSISISIPKHGVWVLALLSSRRGNTNGSSLFFFLAFVRLGGRGKSGSSERVATFFKERVTGSRACGGRRVGGTGRLEEHITVDGPLVTKIKVKVQIKT